MLTRQQNRKNLCDLDQERNVIPNDFLSGFETFNNDKKQNWKSEGETKEIALSPLKLATNLILSLSARKDLDLGKLVNIHTVPSL